MMEIVILLLIGLAAGVASGILENRQAGYSVIPALVYFLELFSEGSSGNLTGLLLPPIGLLAVTKLL
ncbi:MAG: hypothetical protein MZV64_32535 [Ignavibacteriales bacterium]|nr:hypothetical protein [Ignavibacteriales bacterium]